MDYNKSGKTPDTPTKRYVNRDMTSTQPTETSFTDTPQQGRLAPRISARDRVTPRLHTRGCGAPGLNSTSLNRDLVNREGSFYVLALDSFSRLRSPLGRLGGGPTVPNKVLTVGDIGGVPYHARTSDRTHEAYL